MGAGFTRVVGLTTVAILVGRARCGRIAGRSPDRGLTPGSRQPTGAAPVVPRERRESFRCLSHPSQDHDSADLTGRLPSTEGRCTESNSSPREWQKLMGETFIQDGAPSHRITAARGARLRKGSTLREEERERDASLHDREEVHIGTFSTLSSPRSSTPPSSCDRIGPLPSSSDEMLAHSSDGSLHFLSPRPRISFGMQ